MGKTEPASSTRTVLVLNAGSSSLKFATFALHDGADRKLCDGAVEGLGSDSASARARVSSSRFSMRSMAAKTNSAMGTAFTPLPHVMTRSFSSTGGKFSTPVDWVWTHFSVAANRQSCGVSRHAGKLPVNRTSASAAMRQGSAGNGSSMTTGAAAGDRPRPKTHTVTIEGMRFLPDVLTVASGDTILWVNKDLVPHTATSTAGGFDSRDIQPDKSWKFTIRKTGAVAYICTFHPTMKAMLRVKS